MSKYYSVSERHSFILMTHFPFYPFLSPSTYTYTQGYTSPPTGVLPVVDSRPSSRRPTMPTGNICYRAMATTTTTTTTGRSKSSSSRPIRSSRNTTVTVDACRGCRCRSRICTDCESRTRYRRGTPSGGYPR
jgi:hypothetical protein